MLLEISIDSKNQNLGNFRLADHTPANSSVAFAFCIAVVQFFLDSDTLFIAEAGPQVA